ncbi:hypothetical protein [uncultured Cardiobacterium sp.]|uniref:hypothetical protein n=1 Tax=uncultured Cardiobacterium sp. TaxID=417619 RepID=UPI002628D995|nr:hypothetical protein [uncultured Cardiobacterium sp.]
MQPLDALHTARFFDRAGQVALLLLDGFQPFQLTQGEQQGGADEGGQVECGFLHGVYLVGVCGFRQTFFL